MLNEEYLYHRFRVSYRGGLGRGGQIVKRMPQISASVIFSPRYGTGQCIMLAILENVYAAVVITSTNRHWNRLDNHFDYSTLFTQCIDYILVGSTLGIHVS